MTPWLDDGDVRLVPISKAQRDALKKWTLTFGTSREIWHVIDAYDAAPAAKTWTEDFYPEPGSRWLLIPDKPGTTT